MAHGQVAPNGARSQPTRTVARAMVAMYGRHLGAWANGVPKPVAFSAGTLRA